MNKYRFSELVGNTTTLNLLKRTLANNTFRQFSIFCGPYGTGKSTSARIAALSLTCENPSEGQPCLVCPSCRRNIKALESTGESTSVKVINVGKLNSKADVTEIIKDVFVLESSSSNSVYVFEEAHALKCLGSAQTALLEELDRIPPNTYVIMCTTNPNDLLEALRSRAIRFQFNRLTSAESKVLLKVTAESLGVLHVSNEITRMVLAFSKGVPRNIINSVDFIVNNSVSTEEYREFIQDISNETFLVLLQAASVGNTVSMFEQLEELCATRSSQDVIRCFKSFLVSVLFCVEGGITDEFDDSEVSIINSLFTSVKLQKISNLLERLGKSCEESDVKLFFYRVSLALNEKTVSDVFKQNSSLASKESEKAKLSVIDKSKELSECQEVKLHKLKLSSLTGFGGGGTDESVH